MVWIAVYLIIGSIVVLEIVAYLGRAIPLDPTVVLMASDAEIVQLIGISQCPSCHRSCREGTYYTTTMPDAITGNQVQVLTAYECPCGEIARAQLIGSSYAPEHIEFTWPGQGSSN